jgi:hypothetical protein
LQSEPLGLVGRLQVSKVFAGRGLLPTVALSGHPPLRRPIPYRLHPMRQRWVAHLLVYLKSPWMFPSCSPLPDPPLQRSSPVAVLGRGHRRSFGLFEAWFGLRRIGGWMEELLCI